ncbi:flippase-like domain-containing protein [Actinotalea sp. K2]|uniref:flippase-like domain-containing protein n=1 Tax=Actinotalea sp. K2 TaxID=2939438 RepID=UPI0020170B1F|nr:flippase-like domain-containing protein [Actinotalea sp. K2]MCL3861614.1 flippase-like domain-containing protein [Actinotalea sp. K2]
MSVLAPRNRPDLSGLGRRPGRAPADHGVQIIDTPAMRVHHPADLMGLVLACVGIAVVVLLAAYATGTTTGVTEDVQGFAVALRRILFLPIAVLEALITILAPIAVLTELVLRRLVRHALEAVVAGVIGILVALLTAWLITNLGVSDMVWSFSVRINQEWMVTIPALLSGMAALLTAAGARNRRRTVAWSWNLLWLALGVAVITGLVTLPGALVTVLVGRAVGLATRYVSGVQSERAYGAALVDGVRRAGFQPSRLVRVRDVSQDHPDEARPATGDGHTGAPPRQGDPEPTDDAALDPAAVAITRYGDNRVYAMTTTDGDRLDVVVLDGDRQVVGMLTRFWRSLRLRGIDGRAVVSLRQATERAALLSYAAWSAGVVTPRLLGLAESEDSMLLIQQHAEGAVPLRDVPTDALTDEVLDAVWEQLGLAHSAGLAHRALTCDSVLVRTTDQDGPTAWLTGWESGDVASSELARRMDLSQLIAVLALRVGAERAVASASRVLPDADLVRIGPLLQTIALPRTTREEARRNPGVLAEVREALLALLPEADPEPERLVRFGVRTVLTIVLTVAAVVVVFTTFNYDQIAAAFSQAQPWWAAVAFALGLVTFVGSAISLVAFAPIRLPLWRTTLVQVAGAFVALVAPAGVGPAALNLRMLNRRGVHNALAVASVGLVQVSQLITTLALLLVLSLISGTGAPLTLPSRTVIVVAAVVAVALGAAMLVPPVRSWVVARTVPVWRQTWPRLIRMLSQPGRLALAVAGNLLMTLSYLGAFYACLAAFGRELSLIDLALIYLLGNAAGALVPTPGGLGAIELALSGALVSAGGVPAPIALSVVVLFRALTYWARIPFGWLAMRSLQRRGEL